MLRSLVILMLDLLALYAVLGVLFAIVFHVRGLAVMDGAARGAGVGFRLLITPGVIGLWPLLAWRWSRRNGSSSWMGSADRPVSPRRLRAFHALAWKILAVAGPILLGVALAFRPGSLPAQDLRQVAAGLPSGKTGQVGK
jgi:hypothetical protein